MPIRQLRGMGSNVTDCSWAYDPLGIDATDDLTASEQLTDIRVAAFDYGNRAPGQDVVEFSNIDPTTVKLYILAATNQPLVVDTDGDGICDDINPQVIPTAPPGPNQAIQLQLVQVGPQGSPDYTFGPFPNLA